MTEIEQVNGVVAESTPEEDLMRQEVQEISGKLASRYGNGVLLQAQIDIREANGRNSLPVYMAYKSGFQRERGELVARKLELEAKLAFARKKRRQSNYTGRQVNNDLRELLDQSVKEAVSPATGLVAALRRMGVVLEDLRDQVGDLRRQAGFGAGGRRTFTVVGAYKDTGSPWATYADASTPRQAACLAVREMSGMSDPGDLLVLTVLAGKHYDLLGNDQPVPGDVVLSPEWREEKGD